MLSQIMTEVHLTRGGGREIAISRAKPETIYWLKMSKISDLDNFAIDTGETSTCTYALCIRVVAIPKGGGANAPSRPP